MSNSVPPFLDNYLPYLLRRADQRLSAPFYVALTRRGVARSEWRVLAVLLGNDSLPVVDLANLTLSPQPTVTHALRRLEGRGMVTRVLGENDRRNRFVSLTSAGAELTTSLIEEAKRLEAAELGRASDFSDLYEQLRRLANELGQHLDERSGNGYPRKKDSH